MRIIGYSYSRHVYSGVSPLMIEGIWLAAPLLSLINLHYKSGGWELICIFMIIWCLAPLHLIENYIYFSVVAVGYRWKNLQKLNNI